MWSFLFESLEIPKLLIWIILSTRKYSIVFISSSSNLLSLTCSFQSSKLNVLVWVTLVFWMGFKNCFFFLVFFSWESFFSRCGQWLNTRFSLAQSKWRRTFLLFQHLQSLREPPVPFFCCEVVNKNRENSRLCLRSFAQKISIIVTVCVFYWKYNHNTSFYRNFY